MADPSVPYTPIDQGDVDTASGLPTTLGSTLADNDQHDREMVYDPATMTPAVAHDHDGVNSARITLPSMPNLIIDSSPSTRGDDSLDRWHRTGVSVGGGGLNNTGLYFNGSGKYATHIIGGVDSDGDERIPGASLKLFGAGADLVLAIFARAREPMAALTLDFGLTDGHSSTMETGTRFRITQDEIGVGRYRRFYGFLSRYSSAGHSTDVRFGVATSGSFTSGGKVDVTLVMLKAGTVLSWWEPAPCVQRLQNWELLGVGGIGVFDRRAMFRDAVLLEAA